MTINKVFFSRRGLSLALVVLTVLAFAIVLMVSPAAGESQESAIDADTLAMIHAKGDFTPANSGKGLAEALGESVKISRNSATGYASFVRFANGLTVIHAPQDDTSAEVQADAFFAEYGEIFGITDPAVELNYDDTSVDNYGISHVTYNQDYEGLPVFAGVLKVHLNDSNEIMAVNGTFVPDISVNATPRISAEEADQVAVNAVANPRTSLQSSHDLRAVNSELMIYRTGLIQGVPGKNHLVYEVEVANSSVTVREFVYVDAYTGAVVDQISGILADLDREVSEGSLAAVVWDESNGDPDPIPSGWAGGTAQQVIDWNNEIDGAKETYYLFASMANRDSYDGAGATMRTVNNDPGINCPNAMWNGISTNYCTGVTGDDTVAHEWGHAYTEYTNNLIYAWQPGALNESYSDIWGDVVDLLNGRGTDAPGGLRTDGSCSIYGAGTPSVDDSYRWLSGEDDPAFGGAIRDLWNPTCYGDPGKVTDTEYWCSATDGGGVHTNSGVPNHAFALMVDGGTYNSVVVSGIGLTKASHIEWAAQIMLTDASGFVENADALEATCNALTGIDLPARSTSAADAGLSGQVITTTDCIEVSNAIAAVEFRTPPDQCEFEPAWTEAPALCEGQGTGEVLSILFEDWEAGQGAWITGTHDIANPDSFDNPDWVVRGSLPDERSGDAMFVEDSINRGACTPEDTVAGALNLDSPPIVIPAGADVPRVAIDHYVATESGWDGGNLKVSVNDGPWTVVPDTAMYWNGYFAPGAMNGGGNDNPLGGEEGWTGGGEGSVATGWGQTQVDLSGFAGPGDSVELRFDMGLDGCNGVDGWYVDEVEVYSCEEEVAGLCGDGILDPAETCDDGNTDSGDGCSNVCQVEDGWVCEDPAYGFIDPSIDEGFESGEVPPPGWTTVVTNTSYTWEVSTIPKEGTYSAMVLWDPAVDPQDEWLISSEFTPAPDSALQFATMGSPYWCRDTFDNCDVEVWLVVGDLGGSDDVFIGLADDVWHDGSPFIWATQFFDLASLLPGGPVKLAYHYAALDGAQANVDAIQLGEFVDNPSICTPVASELACNADPVDFDAGIPGNWTVVNHEDPGLVWTDLNGCGESGNFTNGSGDAACVSSDIAGYVDYDTELWSNPFSLTDVASPTLEYTANFRNLDTDLLDVDISTNGGISWTNLLSWNDDYGAFRATPGEDVSLDLSDYIGMEDLLLRWHYYNPVPDDWDWYVQVDDVGLSCESPVIDVDPDSLTSSQHPDTVVTMPMTITNLGLADLDWRIGEFDPVLPPAAEFSMTMANERSEGELSYMAAPDTGGEDAVFIAGAPQEYVNLTHSLSQTIVAQNSVACGAGGLHADNSYLRVFDLASFGILTEFDVDSVEIGIQTATGADGTQPATVNLYLWDPSDSFTFGNFDLIGSSQVTVYDADAMTIITVPVSGQAPAGSTLVVEFFTPDGQTAGNSFWVGSNPYGQTAPTYLAAAACGLPEPTDTAAIGFPDMHMVMNVIGSADCAPAADIPWASVDPITGTTTALGNTVVDVTFDSTGYGAGAYFADLCVFSNDPVTSYVIVPLTMNVSAGPTDVSLSSFDVVTPLNLTPLWLAALVSVSILGATLVLRKRKNH